MKTKITYTILIATILGLSTYIYLENNKKDTKDDTSNISNAGIISNSNKESDITSNNISNEIISNSNSNITSNESLSNSNILSNNNINSNEISNKVSNSNNNISNSNSTSNKSNETSNKTSNKKSNTTSNKVSNNQTALNTNGVFSGIYQDKNNMLKVFQLNNKLHYVIFKLDSSYGNNTLYQRSNCTISGNKATCTGNNNTITLNSNSITYSKINSYFTGGTLYKTKNYTIEDYYADFMQGNTSYLNTNNGIYINNNNNDSIKLYQLNENEIKAIINVTKKKDGVRDNSISNTFYKEIELTKSGNKLVGETAYGQIEITVGQGKIIVKASSNNIKDILYHISPNDNPVEYTYKGKYTLNNIVSEHFPN